MLSMHYFKNYSKQHHEELFLVWGIFPPLWNFSIFGEQYHLWGVFPYFWNFSTFGELFPDFRTFSPMGEFSTLVELFQIFPSLRNHFVVNCIKKMVKKMLNTFILFVLFFVTTKLFHGSENIPRLRNSSTYLFKK